MKILAADDDPVWLRMTEAMIREWGDEVVAVSDGQQALDILNAPGRPSLAILDWLMPGVDGLEICRKLRADTEGPYVYVLLLTAKASKVDLIEAFEAGADDYIKKPFDPDELRARLRAAQRIMDLQAALLMAQRELRIQATRDSLTGILNRGAILEMFERELERAKRENYPVAVLLADVDHFKRVNDTHGHDGGDEVLRQVTQRLQSSVRAYDMVGRYGGEELILVLPRCDAEAAARIAERARHEIQATPCRVPAEVPVTISIGVATTAALQSWDSTALIKAADNALYRAKHAGRNRVELARA